MLTLIYRLIYKCYDQRGEVYYVGSLGGIGKYHYCMY